MTLRNNARLAGITFLIYIAVGLTSMNLSGLHSGGDDTAAKLHSIVENISLYRLDILLSLLCALFAVVLAVTLYSLTRDQDPDIAKMGMVCRISEGIVIVIGPAISLGLLWVAQTSATATGADLSALLAAGGLLFKIGSLMGAIASICFSMGSMVFSYLFLRARSIPVSLAWLGVVASILLVAALPLQLAGFLSEAANIYMFIWLPMLVFELALALWLIVKGVAVPAKQ